MSYCLSLIIDYVDKLIPVIYKITKVISTYKSCKGINSPNSKEVEIISSEEKSFYEKFKDKSIDYSLIGLDVVMGNWEDLKVQFNKYLKKNQNQKEYDPNIDDNCFLSKNTISKIVDFLEKCRFVLNVTQQIISLSKLFNGDFPMVSGDSYNELFTYANVISIIIQEFSIFIPGMSYLKYLGIVKTVCSKIVEYMPYKKEILNYCQNYIDPLSKYLSPIVCKIKDELQPFSAYIPFRKEINACQPVVKAVFSKVSSILSWFFS